MPQTVVIDNSTFIQAFRNGQIDRADFHQEQHLCLAYEHVCADDVQEAIRSLRESLIIFLERIEGIPYYHETITVAFVLIVKERVEKLETDHTWETFKLANPDLFDKSQNILLKYYRPETLSSEKARRDFVPPDLIPFSVSVIP